MSYEESNQTARWDASRVREAERREYQRRNSQQPQRRRRRRRGSGFLRFLIWLICVVAISVILAGFGWTLANDFCSFDKEPVETTVEVTKDDDLASVAVKLKEAGLIEHKWFFKLFGRVAHAESKIGIGSYELNSQMDYNALINHMKNNNAALNSSTVKVTIYEGYNVRQIIALLAKYGVGTEEALTEVAKNYDFSYSFLKDAEKGSLTRLEGYLFPDTYEFFVGGDPVAAFDKLLQNFDSKMMADDMVEMVENSGRPLREILTIASLIEKETDGTDRANIASVIYNRLNNRGETYYLLQIDASQIYGLGDRYTGTLTQADLDIDTPYNTHIHEGLPPTPIANPGMASIEAALDPAQTNYYFYALGKDKVHHFFKTYSEFKNFVNGSNYAG